MKNKSLVDKITRSVKTLLEGSFVFICLCLSWNLMSAKAIAVVLAYVLLWFIYYLIPWHRESCPERLKKLLGCVHVILPTVMFAIPIATICLFQFQARVPDWFGSIVNQVASESHGFDSSQKFSVAVDPTHVPDTVNGFIGVAQYSAGWTCSILPTRQFVDAAMTPFANNWLALCAAAWMLTLVLGFAAAFMEVMGDTVARMASLQS